MKFAALLTALLLPTAPCLADQADQDVFIPPTSIEKPSDIGVRAHTNHRIFTGVWTRFDEIQPTEEPMHGPLAFTIAGYHPADIRAAYQLPSTGGTGAIAIIDAYHYSTALNDFNVFAGQFGLPKETSTNVLASTNQVFQVVYQGTAQPTVDGGWNQEEALDIEWAHALAPSAKIYLIEANSSSLSDLFAAVQKAVAIPGVHQISMSWGGSEFSGEKTFDSQLTAPGVVYFAAAGDSAAEKLYPALSPNVVGVGGTTLKLTTSDVLSSEIAWSSTGGGLSTYEAIPSYQKSIASIVGTKRGGPDVALVADPNTGCAIYDSTAYSGLSGWLVAGGTSLATPCVAAITNLCAHNYASTALELAHVYSGIGTANFRDILSGAAGANKAKKGWDLCTGVGCPLGINGM